MQIVKLSADQVTVLMRKLPPAARASGDFEYAHGHLLLPLDWAAAADAVMAVEGWDALPDPLVSLKDRLKRAIDDEAERQRLRWITAGSGQAMTYARKLDQARAVLDAQDPQPDDYPMLAASIGIDGADIQAVAHLVIAMDAAWELTGAAIELARLTGKKAVDLAETAAAAESITVVWPEA